MIQHRRNVQIVQNPYVTFTVHFQFIYLRKIINIIKYKKYFIFNFPYSNNNPLHSFYSKYPSKRKYDKIKFQKNIK